MHFKGLEYLLDVNPGDRVVASKDTMPWIGLVEGTILEVIQVGVGTLVKLPSGHQTAVMLDANRYKKVS